MGKHSGVGGFIRQIEDWVARSSRRGGYLDEIVTPIENFRLAGAALATDSGNAQASEGLDAYSAKWVAGATTTDDIAATIPLPTWLKEDEDGDFQWVTTVKALQYDSTGSAVLDADIKLQATLVVFKSDGDLAYSSGAIAASAVLGVASVNGTLTGIVDQVFDFGADMTVGEKAAIEAGQWATIAIAPNEAVDADVEVHAFSCRHAILRHLRAEL